MEYKRGDLLKIKSKWTGVVEYAMVLSIYEFCGGAKSIHYCAPRKTEDIHSLSDEGYMPFSEIILIERFYSLDAVFNSMEKDGYINSGKVKNLEVNYEKFRLRTLAEIDNIRVKVGEDKFNNYKKIVYNTLWRLKSGEIFEINRNVKSQNLEVFIKITCLYMIEMKGDCNIVFKDGFNQIKGEESFNQYAKELKDRKRYENKQNNNSSKP